MNTKHYILRFYKMLSKWLVLLILLWPVSASAMSNTEILSGVNQIRASKGLNQLTINAQLESSANAKARDMCQKNYWSHGEWVSFVEASGYPYLKAGENLAEGFKDEASTLNGWINSPGHFANMIGDFDEAGIANLNCPGYLGKENSVIVVNHFGRRGAYVKPTPPVIPSTPVVEVVPPQVKDTSRDELIKLLNDALENKLQPQNLLWYK